MTKKEAIQKAWEDIGLGSLADCAESSGWVKIKPTQYQSKYDQLRLLKSNSRTHYIRPMSLDGIDRNNGWISIKIGERFPVHIGYSWGIDDEGHVTGSYLGGHINESFTHYQPIEKPKPPIY